MPYDGRIRRAPTGYQQLTVSSTAVGLTVPSGSDFANVRCSTAGVRYRDAGVDPTASVGQVLNAGEILNYDGALGSIKFIRQSADATLDITYYS